MSGRIPQDFIDELLARSDIVEVVGGRVNLRKAGREYKGLCPFHSEKTPSFTVVPDKGFYHCFGCGAHGTALGFLMEHDRLEFPEAVEELAHAAGLDVPREAQPQGGERRDLHGLMHHAERMYQTALRESAPAVDYLKGRGIDGQTAQRYGIGYAPAGWDFLHSRLGGSAEADRALLDTGLLIENEQGRRYDRFRDRIMFPIRDSRGRTVGFGGRVLGDGEPKYLNSPETVLFHKGRELYGLHEARRAVRDLQRLVVVEGYMDVVGLARHGIGYAVATLGTATTAAQVARLFRVCDEVVFSFDGDRAGRQAAWRAMENTLGEVREGRQVRFVFMPDGEDPDSLVASEGARAFERRLASAVPLADFVVGGLREGLDLSSTDGRARLAALARPLIARIPDPIYRALLVDQLAGAVGLSATRLERLLAGDAPPPPRRAQRPARRRLPGGRPTLIRRALALLLNHPAIALDAPLPEGLATLERPGARLLRGLIEDIRRHPQMNTAMVLEHWRDDDEGRHLGRLLDIEVLDDETGAARELADILGRLADESRRERLRSLDARAEALSPAEKDELRRMLRPEKNG